MITLLVCTLAVGQALADHHIVKRQHGPPGTLVTTFIPDPPFRGGLPPPGWGGPPPGIGGPGPVGGNWGQSGGNRWSDDGLGGGRGGDRDSFGGGRGGKDDFRKKPTTTTAAPKKTTTQEPKPTTTKPAPTTTVGAAWFNSRLTGLSRVYHHAKLRHHYHSDQGIVGAWQRQGFTTESSPGRVISMAAYNQNPNLLDKNCKSLVLLQSVQKMNTDTQFISTTNGHINAKISGGWTVMKSIGYCSKNKACGATKPLRSVTSKDAGDIVYMTDNGEYSRLNGGDKRFMGTGSDVICYLW